MSARSSEAGRRRPHVIIAHADSAYTAGVARAFRRRGWMALHAANGAEARRLAARCPGSLVVLETELPGESGWLTCAKLNLDHPGQRVVLVADDPSEHNMDFAEFSGAVGLITREQGLDPLLEVAGIRQPVHQAV